MTEESTQETTPTFAELGLHPEVLRAVEALGYESPSPIQAATIPALVAGRDVIGLAQTGTGKTAAFAVADPLPPRRGGTGIGRTVRPRAHPHP